MVALACIALSIFSFHNGLVVSVQPDDLGENEALVQSWVSISIFCITSITLTDEGSSTKRKSEKSWFSKGMGCFSFVIQQTSKGLMVISAAHLT